MCDVGHQDKGGRDTGGRNASPGGPLHWEPASVTHTLSPNLAWTVDMVHSVYHEHKTRAWHSGSASRSDFEMHLVPISWCLILAWKTVFGMSRGERRLGEGSGGLILGPAGFLSTSLSFFGPGSDGNGGQSWHRKPWVLPSEPLGEACIRKPPSPRTRVLLEWHLVSGFTELQNQGEGTKRISSR